MNRINIQIEEIDRDFAGLSDVDGILDATLQYVQLYSSVEEKERILAGYPGWGKVFGARTEVLEILAEKTGSFFLKNPDQGELLLRKLWQRGSREEKIIASLGASVLFLKDMPSAYRLYMEWIPDIDNAEICDLMGEKGFKPLIERHPDRARLLAMSLIKSPNPWLRRFGVKVVSVLSDISGDKVLGSVLKMLSPVMKEQEEIVQDAAVIMLRRLATRDPETVWAFISVFLPSEDPGTRRIAREGARGIPGRLKF